MSHTLGMKTLLLLVAPRLSSHVSLLFSDPRPVGSVKFIASIGKPISHVSKVHQCSETAGKVVLICFLQEDVQTLKVVNVLKVRNWSNSPGEILQGGFRTVKIINFVPRRKFESIALVCSCWLIPMQEMNTP